GAARNAGLCRGLLQCSLRSPPTPAGAVRRDGSKLCRLAQCLRRGWSPAAGLALWESRSVRATGALRAGRITASAHTVNAAAPRRGYGGARARALDTPGEVE